MFLNESRKVNIDRQKVDTHDYLGSGRGEKGMGMGDEDNYYMVI
jgi:hypothetical protein